MKILLSTFGSSGDVFPMLGLALELQGRGHEVALATNDHFQPLIAGHGVTFHSLGTLEQFEATIRHPDLWHPQRAFKHVFTSLRPGLKTQYALQAEYPVGVTSCFGFGALLAQEKLGARVITVHLQPAVLWSDHDPPTVPGVFGPRWLRRQLYAFGERFFVDPVVCPFLNPWRAELGLPPVRRITRWWHSPTGVVGMFPDWFCAVQPDWPPGVVLTDFPLWNDQGQAQLSPEAEDFLAAGPPPLVFTPGSTNLHGRGFFQAAVTACARLGERGLLLTQYPEQLPPLPTGVRHFRYLPLNLVLPRARAFIHHGGIGSTSQGLAAGIPQLIMPLAHDQLDNAARLQRLGVGDYLSPARFTGARVAARLQRLLETPDACQKVARRVGSAGLARAAQAIEESG